MRFFVCPAFGIAVFLSTINDIAAAAAFQPKLPMEIPVLVIKYFPVKGDRIDQAVTGDWGESLAETRKKTAVQTEQIVHALQDGSRYHAYEPSRQAEPRLQNPRHHRIPGAAAHRRQVRPERSDDGLQSDYAAGRH